ncbi:GNAT family N-acetyltransferase [uncultured Roseobacter sp.]|uniref:GNAT family N-acetyltransferase n=1 Tax=uncultured Roseobacter sp. TaxID=114847 RepID=UPI00260E238A|nr:GNAT family N-acetyltransferase [uncultured Roseobacter sp.]
MTMHHTEGLAFRAAQPDDADHLANFAVLASKGLAEITWEDLREGDETALDVGRRRAGQSTGGFSYRNADVALRAGAVISAIISYAIEQSGPMDTSGVPEIFHPLIELEEQAAPSWYVNILATYPDARGLGGASALMAGVETRAKKQGHSRMSIIVDAVNPAMKLYEHLGYAEVSRAAFAQPEPDDPDGFWVLMIKKLR